jgi:hypothetical protein
MFRFVDYEVFSKTDFYHVSSICSTNGRDTTRDGAVGIATGYGLDGRGVGV